MTESKNFYYSFNPLNFWLILNCVLLIALIYAAFYCPFLLYWRQVQVLIGTLIFSVIAWWWKYVLKHRMAAVTDDYIAIDHCEPLYWKDIVSAEEKVVSCCFRPHKVIALNPRDGLDYNYNFLQRHNPFPPFSIPLYGIVSDNDIAEITEIIKSKVPYTPIADK